MKEVESHQRVSKRLGSAYYYYSFGFFVACLWLRLVVMDSDGYQLALFFMLIAGVAFATGALFTGRTWCNYFSLSPSLRSFIPMRAILTPKRVSQCASCTACKSACPDINPATGYWMEMGLSSKKNAYFAFPGVTLAFYVYFYFQSGIWAYHLNARWRNQSSLIQCAFDSATSAVAAISRSFQSMPPVAAAAFVLCAGGIASFVLLESIESVTKNTFHGRRDSTAMLRIRHILFGGAAASAFLISGALASQAALATFPAPARVIGTLPVVLQL
jgi:hypothetical protein